MSTDLPTRTSLPNGDASSPSAIGLPSVNKKNVDPPLLETPKPAADISSSSQRPERVYRPEQEHMKQRRRAKKRSLFLRQAQQLTKFLIVGLLSVALYKAFVIFPWTFSGAVEWMGTPSHLVSSKRIENTLAQHTRFFTLKPQQVAEELMDRFPLIEQAVVRRRFFPKQALLVSVTEKPLWGLIYRQPLTPSVIKHPSLVVSSDNLIFPLASLANFQAYQAEHQQYLTHLLIPAHRQEMMTALQLKQLQALADRIRSYPDLGLRYIDLSDPNQLTLVCHGPDVYLGRLDETWETRFDRLISLMPHYKKWTGEMRAIDLRWDNQVTLHPFIKQ